MPEPMNETEIRAALVAISKEATDLEGLAVDLGVKLKVAEAERDRLAGQRGAVLGLVGQEYADASADVQAGGPTDQLDKLSVPVHDLLIALDLLPGATDEGVDAYDQIPRGIEKVKADRDRLAELLDRVRSGIEHYIARTRHADEHPEQVDQGEGEAVALLAEVVAVFSEAVALPHAPMVAELRSGEWGVHCLACSDQAQDYIPRCLIRPDGWPPLVLREAPQSTLLEARARAAADLTPPAGAPA